MKKIGTKEAKGEASASHLIDGKIKELGDWRGETLAQVRGLIKEACPEVVEEWKWRGVPVWEHAGIICTGETYKNVVKLTFAHGASLADPSGLFNASLEGNMRRAIDISEGDKINERALKTLVRAAVEFNQAKKKKAPAATRAKMQKNRKPGACQDDHPDRDEVLTGNAHRSGLEGHGTAVPSTTYGWK